MRFMVAIIQTYIQMNICCKQIYKHAMNVILKLPANQDIAVVTACDDDDDAKELILLLLHLLLMLQVAVFLYSSCLYCGT